MTLSCLCSSISIFFEYEGFPLFAAFVCVDECDVVSILFVCGGLGGRVFMLWGTAVA